MDQTRLEKLKREVNEDDTKWEKIAELRRRLENHQFITWKTTADEARLISCLRSCKYDVDKAQRKVENLLVFWSRFKHYTCWDTDYMDVSRRLLDQGIVVPLKQRDALGRKIVIYDIGKHDFKFAPYSDLIRTLYQTVCLLKEDDMTSLTGFVFIVDGSNLRVQHFLGLRDLQFAEKLSRSTLIRVKLTIVYKFPTIMSWSVKMLRSFLSPKMQKTVKFANSSAELGKILQPKTILPKTMGGEENISDLIESVKDLWNCKKSLELAETNSECYVKIDKIAKRM